jgi:hypothetical protein
MTLTVEMLRKAKKLLIEADRPRWIEAGQRIQRSQGFFKGRIWSSGYVVAKNGIDIEDAFIVIRLPFATEWQYNPSYDEHQRGVVCFMHTRTRGWFQFFDFGT